jgi:hypothetical protein
MDQETKIQSAIIHGCTTRDIELLTEWLQILKSNIFHPLVLPALVLDLIRTKHARLIEDKYRLLVELSGTADQYETLIDDENPLDQVNNYNQTIKSTLQLHQDIGDFGIAAAQTRKQVYRLVELVKTDPPFCPVAQNTNYTTGLKEQLEDILDVYDDLERICDQVTRDCSMLMGAVGHSYSNSPCSTSKANNPFIDIQSHSSTTERGEY